MTESGVMRGRLWAPFSLLLLAAAAWAGGLTHGLQGDDGLLLRAFMEVRDDLPPLHAYFTQPTWGIFYRPLSGFLFDRLFALSWPAVWPLNLFALLVHVCGAVAVVRLVTITGARPGVAWFAGAVFATLPAHAEPVLWTAAVHGMLENVLGLWAMVLVIEGRRGVWRPRRVAGGVVCFLFAIATKETGLVVIGVVAVHDLLWREALDPRARRPAALALVYGPMILGAIAVLVMRRAAYGGFTLLAVNTFDLAYVGAAVVRTLVGSFSPTPWRGVEPLFLSAVRSTVGGAVAVGGIVLVAGGLLARRQRTAVWLWLALWGTVLPLAMVAVVPAERHLYLPSAFAASLLALGVGAWWEGHPRHRRALAVGAVLWLSVQFVSAQQRRGAWRAAALHVRTVLTQTEFFLPRLEPNALLMYLGVPDEVDNALVFRHRNISDFIRARYGSADMQAVMVCTPAELPAGLLDAPGMLRFRINAQGGHLYWPDTMHGDAFARHDAQLIRRGRLGWSYLLHDWINAGKPAYMLVYDAGAHQLRLGDAALRADVAERLFWIDYEGATPVLDWPYASE